MRIRDTFATAIQERIEPVVKVADRNPSVLVGEVANLVVTPQWERYLRIVLDGYANAADSDDEQGIGIWISGFFGSGKSLLLKVLGALLEGGEFEGQSIHELFLSRLAPHSEERSDIQRFLAICQRKVTTTAIGGNLHAQQSTGEDPLALIAFKLFADQQGYTNNWPLAWSVEQQIDARGKTDEFRRRVQELSCLPWEEVRLDPLFHLEHLYEAAAATIPEQFGSGAASVDRAVNLAVYSGVTPDMLVDRLRRWCELRDERGRRHKLLLQLDELGQWISGGNANDRIMQIQALTETAAASGRGRIWLAVTAHGDVQALRQNVQQEQYAKIVQRFAHQCKLSNDDINLVVEDRLLRKTQPARSVLQRQFQERSGQLTDLGSVQKAQRVYRLPDSETFPLFYPFLPWTVTVIPDVVKGIAQAAGRDEALTGSNRTMIGVVQGALIDTPGLLDSSIGKLVGLADLYEQLVTDIPIETKTDLSRIMETVPEAQPLTLRVARALFLLGQASYIPTTLENVTRALVDTMDVELGILSNRVKTELNRLVAAGYAKRTGDQYTFLSTQQRGFQDRVRARQEELTGQTWELIQALKEYDAEDALRFDRVPVEGREILLKLEIDGRTVRNPTATVPIRVYSPLQRTLDPQLGDDNAMRQRSNMEPDAIFFRMDDVGGLRAALAAAVATGEVADQVISANQSSNAEVDVARQAKQLDLPSHKAEVRRMLAEAVRNGTIFFRGTTYQLTAAEGAGASVRATLAQLVPSIYSRFAEVPRRIANEDSAIKAALAGNPGNTDLQQLGVYRSDGTLNDSHPLLSTLRAGLPRAEQMQEPVNADALRTEFERPPFGWDGNCVKVGLALLLRESKCRLIENGKVLSDPSSQDVLLALTKEQRFKALRVEGVQENVPVESRRQIRTHLDLMFGVKPALIESTLSNVISEQLQKVAQDAQQIRSWAATAQCPLPLAFESVTSLVSEILATSAPNARLPLFLEQVEPLQSYLELLDALGQFQREQGSTYQQVRDFFNSVVNAEIDLPEVRQFIGDWRTLTQERSIAEPQRWSELVQTYKSTHQAIRHQVAEWTSGASQRIDELVAGLEARVRDTGIPEDQVTQEVARLVALLTQLRERAQRPDTSLSEARSIRTGLDIAELNLAQQLRDLRIKYGRSPTTNGNGEVRLRLGELINRDRVTSVAELDEVLQGARARVLAELDQDRVVVFE